MKKNYLLLTFVLFVASFTYYSQVPTIFTVSPQMQCASAGGNTAAVTASSTAAGITSFSWVVSGSGTCTPSFTNSAVNGSVINVSLPCCGFYTLTCISYSNTTPMFTVSTSATVFCAPNLSVTATPTAICPGDVATLTAAGAITYTWVPLLLVGNTALVSPSVSTCYTVMGAGANGCTTNTSVCMSLLPAPMISAMAANSVVCHGSSTTLTVTGAGSYTYNWSNGSLGQFVNPTTNTISVIMNASNVFSVLAFHAANTCTSMTSVAVICNTLCANVWPGDANRDGVVSTLDVFELGLLASSTGPARTSTSIAWASQNATAWTTSLSSGFWSRVHADCNGDGIINAADNAAITANFSFTHTFKGAPSSAAGPEIKLVPQLNVAYGGVWNKADILLGDANNSLNIYGVAFDLNYDQSLIVPDSVKLIYTSSFLNATNANIEFGKPVFGNGKVFAATVRTNQQNASGFGKIGELWYKVKSGLPQNASINLSASNGMSINSAGITSTVAAGAQVSLPVNYNVTGLTDATSFDNDLVCWPNPASGFINVKTATNSVCNYSLHDLSGRTVLSGSFQSQHTIDLSGLESGIYFLHTENIGVISSRKVIQK